MTELTDDFDGTDASETIEWAYRGVAYEIDLSKANVREFDQMVKPYIEHSRKVRGARRRRAVGTTSGKRSDLAAIRDWARSAGYTVSDRGRIATEVVEAYEAGH